MALTNDQLTSITKKYYLKKLQDSIFDGDPLLQRYKKKGRYISVSGGTTIMVPLNYALTTAAGWYAGADTLSTTDNEQITAAEYSWKQCYGNISISRDEELKNSGDAQVLDLLKSKVQICEKTVADYIQGGLYASNTNAKSIVGMVLFLSTSNTVGGISQSSYSWWQAQVDSTTTTLTMPALQTTWNNASINNKSPTVVMATRTNFNRYYGLLQPQQRFIDGDTASGGFQNLLFNGAPMIVSSKGTGIMMLNEENLFLWYHPDEDMRMEPFQAPVNQNVKVGKVYWMGAHGTDNCRMHGYLSAITA